MPYGRIGIPDKKTPEMKAVHKARNMAAVNAKKKRRQVLVEYAAEIGLPEPEKAVSTVRRLAWPNLVDNDNLQALLRMMRENRLG